jgi:hypothetical protein
VTSGNCGVSMASPVPFRLRYGSVWRESIILGDAALLCKPHSRSCSRNDVILLATAIEAKRVLFSSQEFLQ